MTLHFDSTIKAGDVLTSVTILLSVIALVLSLAKDRNTRVSDQANKVRTAAATTLVKLDRWQSVQLALYQELQPTFVELSEDLLDQYDVVTVRDKFWKQVNLGRAKIAHQVLEEQLGTAYGDLLTYFPSARRKVVDAFSELGEVENRVTQSFMGSGEQRILSLRGKQADYQTAYLGNLLREAGMAGAEQLKKDSDKVLAPVRAYLFSVIALSDYELVNAARQAPQ
jgi:hypothetical protein